jgi:hypothetical protein
VTADLGVARGFAKLYRPRPAPDDSLRICADAHVVSSVARTKPVRIADMDLPAPHQGRQFRASGEGNFERVDLTLLSIDEQKLPIYGQFTTKNDSNQT